MAQSLTKKLRIKTGSRIALLNLPESEEGYLKDLPSGVSLDGEPEGTYEQVHLFVRNRAELAQLAGPATRMLSPTGLLWVFFPKETSDVQTDLNRDRGWEALRATGVRPVSLIAFDEIWSVFAFRRPSGPARRRSARPSPEISSAVDTARRTVRLPADLQRALKKDIRAAAAFKGLSFTHRKEYVLWILSAKKPDTRARRIAGTVARLLRGNAHQAGR
jgi:hypothetical protein